MHGSDHRMSKYSILSDGIHKIKKTFGEPEGNQFRNKKIDILPEGNTEINRDYFTVWVID